jgi:plastocyanin
MVLTSPSPGAPGAASRPAPAGPKRRAGRWNRIGGTYKYFCIPHEVAGMIGEVIVKK